MKKEIHKMALYYILNNINIPYLDLSKGKMGLSLFYFHYSMHTHNSIYEQFAYELLNDIIEDINDEMPISFSSGICGIGWGIEYLAHYGFLKENTDEILNEMDLQVMLYDSTRFTNYSLYDGLEGIICYVLNRILSTRQVDSSHSFDFNYINNLYKACKQIPKTEQEQYIGIFINWFEQQQISYSFNTILNQIYSIYLKEVNYKNNWQKHLVRLANNQLANL